MEKYIEATNNSSTSVTVSSYASIGGNKGCPAQWRITPKNNTGWIKVGSSTGSAAVLSGSFDGSGRQTVYFVAGSKNETSSPRIAVFDVTSKYYTGYKKTDSIQITQSSGIDELLYTEYRNVEVSPYGSTIDSGSDVPVTITWDVYEVWSVSGDRKIDTESIEYTFTNITSSGAYTTNQTTYSYDNGYPNGVCKIIVNTNNYSTEYSLVQEDIPTVAYNATSADIKYRVYWINYNNGAQYGGQHRSSSLVTISNHNIGSANSGTIRNIRCDNGDNVGYADLSWEVNRESAPVTTYTIYDGVSDATMYINGAAVSGGSYGNITSGSSISGYFIAQNNQFFEDSGDITASPSVVTFTKVNDSRIDFYISSVTSDISFGGGPSVTGSGELELQVSPTEVEFDNTGGTQSVTISVVRSTITPSTSDLYIVSKPNWITETSFSGSLSGTSGCTLNMTASNNYSDSASTNPRTDAVVVGYNGYQDIQLNIAVSQEGHDAQGGNTEGEVTYITVANQVSNTDLSGVENNQIPRGGQFSIIARNGYYFADEINVDGGEATFGGDDGDGHLTSYTITASSDTSVSRIVITGGNVTPIQTTPVYYTITNTVPNTTINSSSVSPGGSVTLSPESGYYIYGNKINVQGSAQINAEYGSVTISNIQSDITISGEATLLTTSYSLSLSQDSIDITEFVNTVNVDDYISTNSPAGTALIYSLSGDSAFEINGSMVSVLRNTTTSPRSCVVTISQNVTNGKSATLTITQAAGTIVPVPDDGYEIVDDYEIVLGQNPLYGTGSTTIQIKKNGSVISPNWSNVVIDQDPQGYAEAMMSDYGNTQRVITVTRDLGMTLMPIESSFFIEYYVDGVSVANTSLVIAWDQPDAV